MANKTKIIPTLIIFVVSLAGMAKSPELLAQSHEDRIEQMRQHDDSCRQIRHRLYATILRGKYVVILEPNGWAKVQYKEAASGIIVTLSLTPEESADFYRYAQIARARVDAVETKNRKNGK